MKTIFTFCLLFILNLASAQIVADFENFDLPVDSFLNGSQGNESFVSGAISLDNDYNADWGSWSGWAISTMTDVVTADYTNDLSAVSGSGYESLTYAVAFGNSTIKPLESITNGTFIPEGFYINNNTYAYYVIQDGNQFSKKFGGADGTDEDYFVVHFVGYESGTAKDTVDFYLADYRSDDDYIVNNWTWVDLTSLGTVDSIGYSFETTDVGDFGPNTPLYFCMDDFTARMDTRTEDIQVDVNVYPNPTSDFIMIETLTQVEKISLYRRDGKLALSQVGENYIDVRSLASDVYIAVIDTAEGRAIQKIIKK